MPHENPDAGGTNPCHRGPGRGGGASPTPTPDIPATVTAAVQAALPTPTPTPNIEATVEARVRATLAALPTPIPTSIPTPTACIVQVDGRSYKQYARPPLVTIDASAAYTATIKGDMTVELSASQAPKTVNNFVFLAREGFYDGLTFHRGLKDFVIQGGDPQGDGAGGPGYRFPDEPVTRGYTHGILAMANAGPNTNGSQFFIVHGLDISQSHGLPPNYTIFGQVSAGMDTLDRLAATPVRANAQGACSLPVEPLVIQSIRITPSK